MSSQAIFWIVVIVVSIIALLIHTYIVEVGIDDIEDIIESLIVGFGWITVLVVIGIGAIVYGFLFWIWWIMLIIVVGVALIALVAWIIWKIIDNRFYDDMEVEDEEDEIIKTKYKCGNCGANVSKIIIADEYGDEKIIYKCEYCGITYTKKELLGIKTESNDDNKYTGIDLTDFEEEYFDACERFFYKPYNKHSRTRIESKYNFLTNKIDNGDDIYDDLEWSDDATEILDTAYEFLTENEQEIEEYFSKVDETEIKRRYEFYCLLQSSDTDDDETDD